ncbi:MAG: sodium transporter, partial [Pseudomonadales bacterium]|nr:sodium transporter [Pseudomonadales bacterium]
DRTYGELMKLAPEGLRGLVFSALIAAIVSSLASMMNSISTIFTMDIYRDYIAKDKGERHYVMIGRMTALAAMVAALALAQPFLGGMESAFQTIQEYTGFIAPGVVAIFLLGFFYKRANKVGAFVVLIGSVVASLGLKFGFPEMPFVLRIWFVFLTTISMGVLASYVTAQPAPDQPVELGDIQFHTRTPFNVVALIIILLLVTIYVVYW